jgi:hypothetical protein
MENQLHLRITTNSSTDTSTAGPDWLLDDTIREIGRSGIAMARAALEAARRTRIDDHPGEDRPEVPTGPGRDGLDHTTAA